MIIQEISCAAQTALSVSTVVGSIIGGVIGNKSDFLLDKTNNILYNRFKNDLDAPGNHDIVKAVREAYLKATLIGCKAFIKSEFGAISRIYDPEAKEVKSICKYLYEELNNVKKDKLKHAHYSNVEKFSVFLDNHNSNSISAHGQSEEILLQSLFQELHWYTVSESLKAHFVNGWIDGDAGMEQFEEALAFLDEIIVENFDIYNVVPKAKFHKARILWLLKNYNYKPSALGLLSDAMNDIKRFEDDYIELIYMIEQLMAEIKEEYSSGDPSLN